MDPDTILSLRSRIRMNLLPYCEGGSMIPVDLSANCEGWIYDPDGSGIQILGIRSRDPFSGSTDMSAHRFSPYVWKKNEMMCAKRRGCSVCKSCIVNSDCIWRRPLNPRSQIGLPGSGRLRTCGHDESIFGALSSKATRLCEEFSSCLPYKQHGLIFIFTDTGSVDVSHPELQEYMADSA